LESLKQQNKNNVVPENFGEAIQDLTIDTSLLLKDDADIDLTMIKKNQTHPSQQQMKQHPMSGSYQRPDNFDRLPWEEQKLKYEQEIKNLRQQLVTQRRYFLQLLELPPDLEEALRAELGNEKFNLLYYGNGDSNN
jgi:hypothetical protein